MDTFVTPQYVFDEWQLAWVAQYRKFYNFNTIRNSCFRTFTSGKWVWTHLRKTV